MNNPTSFISSFPLQESRQPYHPPVATALVVATLHLMVGTEQNVPFDPRDGTDDALAKPHDEAPAEDWGHLW
ncbi:MAG: hypothetical protein IKG96_00445 [Bacteroidaceae bacterium]|nr:hypothetical protein [Bacteroidaceae bacterium]